MARLSSGARIQNAGDDAAGFMISKGLEVKQRGLNTANNNIQMGMSLLGIAEGSIQTMLSPLYRIRDLALQSSNGIYSAEERKAMQMEVDSLFEEITRIKNTTEFNGVNLFGQQIYKDKSETFVDNETAAAISLLSYTPAPMMMSASPVNQTTEPEATNTESDTTTQNSEPIMMMSSAPMMRSAGANPNIIEGSVTLASGKSKTISIGDKVYTFKDGNSGLTENTCNYSYDTTTGKLTLSNTYYMTITAATGQEDNIFVNNAGTNTYIYAGDKDDRVEATGSAGTVRIYGGSGDDYLIDNLDYLGASSFVSGEGGNDTIVVNRNKTIAYGGDGDDTFILNGNEISALGGNNNDAFISNGNNNFLHGGSGTNIIDEDNGIDTGWNNILGLENCNPTSGTIYVGSGTARLVFENNLGEKKYYTVKNTANSIVEYSYDTATDTVTFGGLYAQIIADDNQINNVVLDGNYVTYTGGSGGEDNIITSSAYSSQIINLGTGTNTVTTNSAYVSIYTNGGNDTINLNSNNNYVTVANSGNANIVVGGSKVNNIINGGDNTNLTITNNGTGTGYINCVGYENSLPKQGTIYLQVNEEFDITLMKGTVYEASYTVKNKNSSGVSRLNYSCNTTTGEITFNTNSLPNAVQVTAHSGQNDKIITNGNGLYLYTGDGNDIVTSKSAYNSIVDTGEGDDILNITSAPGTLSIDYPEYYTGAGDDTVTVASGVKNIDIWTGDGADTVEMNGTNNNLYTEAGADTITLNGSNNSIYAGDDNDTVNLNASNDGYVTDLGAGDDIANINANNAGSIAGGDGDDNFVVATGVAGAFVDGNAGTNTLAGDTTNTYRYNIEGYENRLPASGSIAIAGNDTISINILGKTYSIKNRAASSSILKFDYNQTTGLMTFEGASLSIESATGQANNVVVNGDNMYFYGSTAQDIITMNGENAKAYGYAGDDTITTAGGKSYAYGGAGNDTIHTNGAQNYAYGEAGNDTIIINGGNAQAEGGNDDDTITLNGILGNTSSWVKGGAGNDTINVNSANNTGAIQGDDGDDTINVYGTGNTVDGGEGSNILGLGASAGSTNFDTSKFNKAVALENSGSIANNLSQELNFEIAGKTYKIESNSPGYLNYSYNETTGTITFDGLDTEITSISGQANNVAIGGDYMRFNGADENDLITVTTHIHGNTVYSYGGNDTIIVQGPDSNINAGAGDDTIISNGNNSFINGDNGNDTIIVNAENNTVSGGAGNNTLEMNADNITYSVSEFNKLVARRNEGTIKFEAGEDVEFEIGGKTYWMCSDIAQTVNYSLQNGVLTIEGNDLEMEDAVEQEDNIKFIGDNNVFYGWGMDDKIEAYGNNNEMRGGAGNDTITIVGDDGYGHGSTGNDTITINGNNGKIYGNGGDDIITITGTSAIAKGHSGGDKITVTGESADIDTGVGDDNVVLIGDNSSISGGDDNNKRITIDGENIDVTLGDGNNIITANGIMQDIQVGNGNNTITSTGEEGQIIIGNGDNTTTINGNNTSVTTGNGNNTITSYGDENAITSGSGADTIKLFGNMNIVETGAGADTILLEGDDNNISLGTGNDTATILGDLNTVDGGEDYDIITNGGTNTTISNCNELWKEADPFLFQVGTEIGANSAIEVSTGFVIPIIDLNILDADSARSALEDIDRVINTLTEKLGEIGVSKNRLESALSANEVAEINIEAARSNIVDADIAEESMEFLKAQILQNASASLLTASRDINSTSLLNIYNSLGNLRR